MNRRGALIVFLLLSVVPSFAHHLAVVTNKQNPMNQVSSAQLSRIFQAEVKAWPDGTPVVLVLHRSSDGEQSTLERLNRMTAAQLQSDFAAHKSSILLVDSDAEVLTAVRTTRGAIGLVEVHSINDQVNVVKVDGKLPMEAGYLPH